MDDLSCHVAQAVSTHEHRRTDEQQPLQEATIARWSGSGEARATRHQKPVVRAFPGSTAHPTAEAWHEGRSARLHDRLVSTTSATLDRTRRSVVVLPSRSVDRWHEPRAETRSYEERLLSVLFELQDPNLDLTYVSSLPIAQRTIDYYVSLLPRRFRLSARKRMRLVSLDDNTRRPLSEKLLSRPGVLAQIRDTLASPKLAYLLPYNSTAVEREVALALGVPLYGADPAHAWLGTKSGGRALFASAGVQHPMGVRHVRSIADVTDAICGLRRAKPALSEVVIKLDNAVSGEGNVLLDLTSLPAPGADREREFIQERLGHVAPDVDGVTPDAFLRKLATQAGVVEERITARELRSPSVQLWITPTGGIQLLSTHDQILCGRDGQRFAGCRFPADPAYAPAVSALGRRVAQLLADIGVIGPLAVDFVAARDQNHRWQLFALEVNLRMGGTTHPYQTLARLTGGRYDPMTASFNTERGQARHYVATDHLEIPQLRELGHAGLLTRASRHDLRFDDKHGCGVVFHMLSSVEPLSTVGLTAIADSSGRADDLFAHVRTVLANSHDKRARRAHQPMSPALDTPG